MEICKAPTLRLKAPNKHTHIMYIKMENVNPFFFSHKKHVYIDNGASIIMQKMHTHTHTHAHTHTLYRLRGVKDNVV